VYGTQRTKYRTFNALSQRPRRAGRRRCAPGREAPVPPVGLRGLWGESEVGIRCLGSAAVTGGNTPCGWPSRMPVRGGLCVDFSRMGSSGSRQELYEPLAHMSEPPGSRCLRAGKTKSCDPRTLGDHIRKARIERGLSAALFQVDARTRSVRKTGKRTPPVT
jgi:hypothetical protein